MRPRCVEVEIAESGQNTRWPHARIHAWGQSLALMMACSRLTMARSGTRVSAIFASAALSPSILSAPAFSSWPRCFIAARSSAVKPPDVLPSAAALLSSRTTLP